MVLRDWLLRYRNVAPRRIARHLSLRSHRRRLAWSTTWAAGDQPVEVLEVRLPLGDVLGLSSALVGGGAGARA